MIKCSSVYSSADTDRDGWVQLNYEQFMKVSPGYRE